ncbi:unnamed protein product, partial [Symbiodinium sp. CCMP2456]
MISKPLALSLMPWRKQGQKRRRVAAEVAKAVGSLVSEVTEVFNAITRGSNDHLGTSQDGGRVAKAKTFCETAGALQEQLCAAGVHSLAGAAEAVAANDEDFSHRVGQDEGGAVCTESHGHATDSHGVTQVNRGTNRGQLLGKRRKQRPRVRFDCNLYQDKEVERKLVVLVEQLEK